MFRVLLVVPYPKLEQTVKKIYKEYFRDTSQTRTNRKKNLQRILS